MSEPTAEARQIAFQILKRHPDCIRDGMVLNDLIDDIADAIGAAAMAAEQFGRLSERAGQGKPQKSKLPPTNLRDLYPKLYPPEAK